MKKENNSNIEIEYMSIDELKPYEKNARKHADYDVSQIAKSIEKYGFNDPIGIWSKKNIIVEGHGRLEAAKKLGLSKVPVIRLDHLTDKERREYAIMHNKSAELSEWDFDFLQDELNDLDFLDFDIDWGLNDDVIGLDTNLNEQQAVDTDNADEGKECECPNCGFKFYL